MKKFIYHSKDLDGIFCGVIASLAFQDPILIGYDYGEKFDIRDYRSQAIGMADVSLPIEDMFTLAKNSKSLTWYDHHLSAFDAFIQYLKDKKIEARKMEVNGLITLYEVPELNFKYYYSKVLSGCEIVLMTEYNDYGNDVLKKTVRLLGQYDTWRNVTDKQLISDGNWELEALPFQYGMRVYKKPEDVDIYDINVEQKIYCGQSILDYQKNINSGIMKNKFLVDINGLVAIAVNSNFFNSQLFSDVYIDEVHDVMMPFCYDGNGVWKFSLYTTKENVDILSIAKSFNGGGHPKACGFMLKTSELNKIFENGFQF